MRPKKFLGILFFTIFLDLLGCGLIIPLLPDYARSLGMSALLVGVVAASFSITQFLFGPVLGSLSDRFGRRPILLFTVALNTIAYLVFGLASTLPLLLASRLLAGAASSNLSVAQAYITDLIPPESRAKSMGMIGTALGLGFIFGPPMGGAIKLYLGIEWVGYLATLMAGLNLLLAIIFLPESLPAGATSTRPVRFLDGAVLAAVGRSPQLIRLFGVYFLFTLAFALLAVSGTLLWKDRFGLNAAQIGYTFAGIGVVTVIVQGGLLGPLVQRFGERRLLLTGLLLMALGFLPMPFVAPDSFGTTEFGLIVILSIGYALVLPTGTALVSRSVNQDDQGQVLGQYQSTAALARITGPILGSTLYDWHFEIPCLVGGGIMLITWLLAQSISQADSGPALLTR